MGPLYTKLIEQIHRKKYGRSGCSLRASVLRGDGETKLWKVWKFSLSRKLITTSINTVTFHRSKHIGVRVTVTDGSSASRDVFEDEIATLKSNLAEARDDFMSRRRAQIAEEELIMTMTGSVADSERKHKTMWAMRTFVKATWSVAIYKEFATFYDEAKKGVAETGVLNGPVAVRNFYEAWITYQRKQGFTGCIDTEDGSFFEPLI